MGKAAVTRSLLLKTAAEVMGTKGYESASIDEIAERAEVSKGIVYYHFKNKAAIAECILVEGLDGLVFCFRDIASRSTDSTDALKKMVESFINALYDHKSFGRFLIAEYARCDRPWGPAVQVRIKELQRIVAKEILCLRAQDRIRQSVNPEFAATAILGLTLSLSLDYVVNGSGYDKQTVLEHLIVFVQYALAQEH